MLIGTVRGDLHDIGKNLVGGAGRKWHHEICEGLLGTPDEMQPLERCLVKTVWALMKSSVFTGFLKFSAGI